MTVGVGAISQNNESPQVVMAADRMVTLRSSIEYEDTNSKLETIVETDSLTAVAVGSGSLYLIDELITRLEGYLVDEPPSSMRDLMELARRSFQEMEQDTIENNVLSSFDMELSDLSDKDTHLSPQFEEAVINDIASVREQLRNGMNLLFGGVSDGHPEIYSLEGPDFTNHTGSGYAVVGSGQQSAESLFIRNRYDSEQANLPQAIFSVGEAKVQAEERQGVGQKMDMVVVGSGSVETVDEIQDLRDEIDKISERQKQVRENIIREWE